jgi:hypothetical protein
LELFNSKPNITDFFKPIIRIVEKFINKNISSQTPFIRISFNPALF